MIRVGNKTVEWFKMKPILVTTLTGDVIREYPSIKHAVLDGYSSSMIWMHVTNQIKNPKKYTFKYKQP